MSRRDTIIIAVLVNAGILLVLFALAMPSSKEEERPVTSAPIMDSAEEFVVQNAGMTRAAEKTAVVDEIDQVLSEWNEQSAGAVIAPAEETVNYPLETAVVADKPKEEPLKAAEKTLEVVVKKGDALDKIARQHGCTAAEIMKMNHLSSNKLQIGQVLQVPDKGKSRSKSSKAKVSKGDSEFYTVKSGDNPWTIANKNQIKLEDLLKLNDLNEDSAKKLKPGDKIRIK